MLNRAIIQGRLVANPSLRATQGGTSCATFTLACDREFKSKDRECDFIDIVAWRSTAEFVSRNFTKGQMAIVSGRIQKRDYTDKDGQKRYITEVVADQVYFAGDRKKEEEPKFAELNEEDEALPF